MKSQFSKSWRNSIQPRKQHKFIANAPLHIMHKFLSANLSKSLRELHGKRSLPLKTGDEVLVMRGKFKKKTAKVTSVDIKKGYVYLEGIQRTKKEGTKVNIPFNASTLQIKSLNLEDKRRVSSNAKETKKVKPTKGEKNAPNKA